MSEKIKKEKERWEKETLNPLIDKMPERESKFTTVSGKEIGRLYTPDDITNIDFMHDISFPGEYPYTRGVQANMYRGRFWTFRQFSGFGTPEDTNNRYKHLLEQGQMGLSVAFDLPTLMGYDSDHELSQGEVGKCGVAVDTLADMETIFDGIPLQEITTSMTINAPAAIIFAMYVAVAEKQGADIKKIGGTIQNDILKEYIAQKEWIFPVRPSMRLITDTFRFCVEDVPKWNMISISGYHIREAGASAVQELAFTIADGIAYVQAGIEAGLDVDDFAPRLSYFFNSHNDFFEEIAKFRASRRMWARIMRERFKAKNPRSWLMRFHTQTAGCSLTAQQVDNNVIRTAIQGLAAVLGGTQSLHINSKDEAWAVPTEEAATLSLRTQQVIAYESGVANTIDPLAGSYFVEKLTNEIEEEAMDYIRKIDEMGGMVAAVEKGFPQREIQETAYWYQKAVERKEKIIVGVNKYVVDEEPIPAYLPIDPVKEGEKQKEKIRKIKASRDNDEVKRCLKEITRVAQTNENLMPFILDAAKAYATLGEIVDALKVVFGEYQEPASF
jgi:methylmalonyl-CoA mutase N-terminal domain/subunit